MPATRRALCVGVASLHFIQISPRAKSAKNILYSRNLSGVAKMFLINVVEGLGIAQWKVDAH
jgi:hypothetical protein